MNMMKTRPISKLTLAVFCLLTALLLSACGTSLSSDTITVNSDGSYAYAPIGDADYYVVRFFHAEDIVDGQIREEARPALKQTLQAAAGTTGTLKKIGKLAFGTYYPTIYGLHMDKTTTDTVIGDQLVIGGTLTAPEIVAQNDHGQIKVSVTDKSFDDYYFNTEALYSFTAEVYETSDCSGTPVATASFGADAAYIEPTNSSKAIWIRNRSAVFTVDGDGTYFVRCRAEGNSDALVESSPWSETVSVTTASGATDVKYCVGVYDGATGEVTMTSEALLEFGNGAAMFTSFTQTDDPETVKDGDLYTFNGPANCDLHLMGSAGDTQGEAYTCGPRLMPIDKPDIRGEWTANSDGTITVTLMADYQYYVDEADKKTT